MVKGIVRAHRLPGHSQDGLIFVRSHRANATDQGIHIDAQSRWIRQGRDRQSRVFLPSPNAGEPGHRVASRMRYAVLGVMLTFASSRNVTMPITSRPRVEPNHLPRPTVGAGSLHIGEFTKRQPVQPLCSHRQSPALVATCTNRQEPAKSMCSEPKPVVLPSALVRWVNKPSCHPRSRAVDIAAVVDSPMAD